MPTYKLTYFPARGRAEITRLIFAQAGVKYEDVRIPGDKWQELKPKTPWKSMPFLEVDGKVIGQSIAIARYVARENGLAGKNSMEQALADSVVDALQDFSMNLMKVHFEKDEAKKAELEKKLKEQDMPAAFGNLEKFLGSNQYFAGGQLTWADLAFFNIADNIQNKYPDSFSKYPKLDALHKRVAALPNIKKWVETRPKSDM